MLKTPACTWKRIQVTKEFSYMCCFQVYPLCDIAYILLDGILLCVRWNANAIRPPNKQLYGWLFELEIDHITCYVRKLFTNATTIFHHQRDLQWRAMWLMQVCISKRHQLALLYDKSYQTLPPLTIIGVTSISANPWQAFLARIHCCSYRYIKYVAVAHLFYGTPFVEWPYPLRKEYTVTLAVFGNC